MPFARAELKHVSMNAERLLRRYEDDERASFFRRLTVESTLRTT